MRLTKLLFTGFLLPFLGLTSCNDAAPELRAGQQAYFDVPDFIAQQIAVLEKEPVQVLKTVGFEAEKPETRTLQNPDWEKELALFQEIDLNKKALAGNYTETRTVLPAGEKVLYTRIPESNASISRLEVTFNQQKQVTELRAIYEQKNALFYNQEERRLQTRSGRKLKAYRISGVQKILFFDSLRYQVASTLP